MKWDIDKSLAGLMALPSTSVDVTRSLVHKDLWSVYRVTPKTEALAIWLWCISIGKPGYPAWQSYGLTIREAFLKLRKDIKSYPADILSDYGIRKPKKAVPSKDRRKHK